MQHRDEYVRYTKKKINNFKWLMQWQGRQIACHRPYMSPDLMNYFRWLHLRRNARIFVPLCGKSKDMQWLAQQVESVIGVELSPIACRDFFAEMNVKPRITRKKNFIHYKHGKIELLCGDFFKLKPTDLPTINTIYDCRALVALPPTIRQAYVRHLLDFCDKPVKIFLIGFNSTDQIKGPPFSVSDDEIKHLFGAGYKVQIIKDKPLTKIPKHLAARGFQQITSKIYIISV